MKYELVLVILGVVAAQIVFAQTGDHQQPPGGDHGKPEAPGPKLALHRFRRQVPVPAGGGQMGGGASMGFSVGGQAGGQAGGQGGGEGGADGGAGAGGQAGAGAQFGFGAQAGVGGGAGAGGGAK